MINLGKKIQISVTTVSRQALGIKSYKPFSVIKSSAPLNLLSWNGSFFLYEMLTLSHIQHAADDFENIVND